MGQLGKGDLISEEGFVELKQDVKFEKVKSGWVHSLGITKDGQCYSWGNSHFNQLGHGDFTTKTVPTKIESVSSQKIIYASAGLHHTLLVNGKFPPVLCYCLLGIRAYELMVVGNGMLQK